MTHDESPTARALLVLELIQNRPGVTAERLADRLGVSERAARRYVAILREAGIPIESTRGPHGGYRVGRGLRLPPLMFTATEALGLVMAVLDGHRVDDPVATALGKLMRVLPESIANPAETVWKLSVDRVAAVEELNGTFTRPNSIHLRHSRSTCPRGGLVDPPNLGRREEIDANHTRLVATTDEPDWYARQLTAIEAPFRIVKPNELRDAARELGRRLKRASDYR